MTASGGRMAAAASAPPRSRRCRPCSPRRAQARAERTQDLPLVVDDEDALAAHASSSAICDRQREHERRALAWTRLGPHATAVGLGEARARSRGRARHRRPRRWTSRAGTARRPLEISDAGMPRPWSITRTITSPDVRVTSTPTRRPSGEYLSAFSIRLTSARSIWFEVDPHHRRARPAASRRSAVRRLRARRAPERRARRRPQTSASGHGSARPAGARGRAGSRPDGRAGAPR